MHKMVFAHVFGPEKKNGFGSFSYTFFVCIRVGPLLFVYFQVNNGVLYFLDYEDIYIMALCVLVSM